MGLRAHSLGTTGSGQQGCPRPRPRPPAAALQQNLQGGLSAALCSFQEALLAEWEGISPAANVNIIPEQPSTPASRSSRCGFHGHSVQNGFAHKCGDPPRQSRGEKKTPVQLSSAAAPSVCLSLLPPGPIREGSCWLHGPLVSAPKPGLEHPPGGWFVILTV